MNIRPIHARSPHPQTVCKLERPHRAVKEVVNLHVYGSPLGLSPAIEESYRFNYYWRYTGGLTS